MPKNKREVNKKEEKIIKNIVGKEFGIILILDVIILNVKIIKIMVVEE